MQSVPGTYALILQNKENATIQVGRWREIECKCGFYIYVGSAFGTGGVRARLKRHCRLQKARHWHIDYLRECVTVLGAWISYEPCRLEHSWAQTIGSSNGITKIKGFGCTDCDCPTHLFFSPEKPSFSTYSGLMEGRMEEWNYADTRQVRQ
jgi:Uri superfamily endonuclease